MPLRHKNCLPIANDFQGNSTPIGSQNGLKGWSARSYPYPPDFWGTHLFCPPKLQRTRFTQSAPTSPYLPFGTQHLVPLSPKYCRNDLSNSRCAYLSIDCGSALSYSIALFNFSHQTPPQIFHYTDNQGIAHKERSPSCRSTLRMIIWEAVKPLQFYRREPTIPPGNHLHHMLKARGARASLTCDYRTRRAIQRIGKRHRPLRVCVNSAVRPLAHYLFAPR